MKKFLVGGAVRDKLLGFPVKERDWVVVGASESDMLSLGYKKVGRAFPVFLHPETKEEYALARTEKKMGKGYLQFDCYYGKDVTLEDDLLRRDITVNAIAEDENGELIDPYGGLQDLHNKIIRHTSSAFVEDPVRVLRIARFAARFRDFAIYADTKNLMKEIVKNGEIDALVPERVWLEMSKALNEIEPSRFFKVLEDCGAAEILFSQFFAIAEDADFSEKKNQNRTVTHVCEKSINASGLYEKAMRALDYVSIQNIFKSTTGESCIRTQSPDEIATNVCENHEFYLEPDVYTRFASFFGNLHPKELRILLSKYRVPKSYSRIAVLVSKEKDFYISVVQNVNENCINKIDVAHMLQLLEVTSVYRENECINFERFVVACTVILLADDRCKLLDTKKDYEFRKSRCYCFLLECIRVTKSDYVKKKISDAVAYSNNDGKLLKEKVHEIRLTELLKIFAEDKYAEF